MNKPAGCSKFIAWSLLVAAFLFLPALSRAETVSISSLDLTLARQDYGKTTPNLSVNGKPLSIGATPFSDGVGTHASSLILIDLKKSATRFTASVGVDDEVKNSAASVEFQVKADDKIVWKSGVMKAGDAAKKVDVDVGGAGILSLVVTAAGDGINYDHADWAEAVLEYSGAKPETIQVPAPPRIVLTPKAGPAPRINDASVFGVRPGNPFLYSIPATGTRPMAFAADGLPAGLSLDAATGVLKDKGEFAVVLHAKNSLGEAGKKFRIVVGDEIGLTPPMGWNSWNCWGGHVTQEKVMSSARAMVAAGLDQHGWTYINIDDTWQGERGGAFNGIQPDPKRFADIKGLCDAVHGMGLKVGIYSTPWTVSYGHRLGGSSNNPGGKWDAGVNLHTAVNHRIYPYSVGTTHFAKNDAQQWAAWGFDYLKYDWGPVDIENTREMGDSLRAPGRDIFYSLSNNGAGNIFSIITGLSGLANAWRTTNDIGESWGSMESIGFNENPWAPFQRPGHYNDPDMLIVGNIGWGNPHPTKLTPDEQYTHISLWCILGAPLLLGCDLAALDDFTLGLLTNDEVLEIDQDPLCKQGIKVSGKGSLDVYEKPMEDGSVAVGLFNRGAGEATITATWADLKLTGKQIVRDLWRQKDLGVYSDKFEAPVASHGVVLLGIKPAN